MLITKTRASATLSHIHSGVHVVHAREDRGCGMSHRCFSRIPFGVLLLAGLNIATTAQRLCLSHRKWIFAQNFCYFVPDREFYLAFLTLSTKKPACLNGLSPTLRFVAHFSSLVRIN
jgi:hypothetical protein